MATLTQATKNVTAAEKAERAARIRAEQSRLDTERAEQERETKNRRAREAQDGRERAIRERLTPWIPFEFNGFRALVLLGHSDPARRNMAAHACTVLARLVTNMFIDSVLRYRLTGEQPPVIDWPSAVLNQSELYEAGRHGVVVGEKVPE